MIRSKHFPLYLLMSAFLGVHHFAKALRSPQSTYSYVDYRGVPLDHMLIELLNREHGTFIEVGAVDGLFQSNTKLLEEQYGWTGILVEPSGNLFEQLCKNRPYSHCFQCALGSLEENDTYAYGDFDGHPMSSLTGRRDNPQSSRVLIRSLQAILDECKSSKRSPMPPIIWF